MTKLFIAAALVASSLPALADGTRFDNYPQNITSNVTRAEVIAELTRARANGELVSGERIFVALPVGRALSRAEVIAEMTRARANGELVSGEHPFTALPVGQALSRAEVIAELARARANGELN